MKNKEFAILRILYFIRYFGDALFYSFFQIFLSYKGLSEGNIGMVASIAPITGIICNPFWNHLAKDVNSNKKIMKWITIIEGIFFLIFIPLDRLELICIITCLIAIVGSPFYTLMDGFASTYVEQNNIPYAKMRIMGSLAYVFGTILGGVFIESFDYKITIIIAAIIFILCSIIIHFLNPIPVLDNKENTKKDYKAILKNKNFYLYALFYLFTVTISVQGDNFMSLFLTKDCGLSTSTYGIVGGIIILFEVITMFIMSKIKYEGHEAKFLIFAGAMYFLRSFLLGFKLPIFLIIAIVFLRGISWGCVLAIHIKYLIKLVGLKNITAAIFILAIFTSIFSFIASNIFGRVIETIGYNFTYLIIGIICASATVLYLCYLLIINRQKKEISIDNV